MRNVSRVSKLGKAIAFALAGLSSASAMAAIAPDDIERITISGNSDSTFPRTMAAVDSGKIFEGKKTSVVELDEMPNFIEPNLRQMFSTLPGLFVSDQAIPSFYNVNYRGLGNPHESEFVGFFQNNIPLAADLFGYPTIYYMPPAQRIERIEFVRGGSGLIYGPQIGPTVNFITKRAEVGRDTGFRTDQAIGSNGLYSTYNEFATSTGDFGFFASVDHRSADGPRDNEDFDVTSGHVSVAYEGFDDIRLGFELDVYNSDSGEAGRLSTTEFEQDRNQTLTPFNRVEIEQVLANFTFAQKISDSATLDANVWYSYMDRFSRRSGQFSEPENEPATTNIDQQEFDNWGFDARYAQAWGDNNVLTVGTTSYWGDSPRTRHVSSDIRSNQQNAADLLFDQDRKMTYNAVFIENLFKFDKLSVVPTLRYERVNYDLEELTKNTSLNRDPIDVDETENELLLGLGMMYQLNEISELYANVSESYRPQRFDDLANPNSELASSNGPDVSSAMNYEFGYRAMPVDGLVLDVSAFRIDFDDKIETIQVNIADIERVNSGDSRHQGVEFSVDYDLFAGRADESFRIFANGSLLDAEIVSSLNESLVGNTTAFAPEYLLRAGFIYNTEKLDVALTATMVDEQFWQDSNASRGTGIDEIAALIPSYEVVDLTAEYRIDSQWAVYGGINNLLDENYYSRVRNDGIEPALERTVFAGVRFQM